VAVKVSVGLELSNGSLSPGSWLTICFADCPETSINATSMLISISNISIIIIIIINMERFNVA